MTQIRPWVRVTPTFVVVTIFHLGSIAKLAGWFFVVLRLNK
jgi:hypothetical protein